MPDSATVNPRVLVVDDNADSSAMLALLLERAGFKVRTAISGQIALGTYLNFRPHTVLLDLGLPGMDGFEVCKKMRQLPDSKSVLIVIVSGYMQDEQKMKAVEAGANCYFVKPVEFGKLLELVTQHGASGA